MCMVNYIDKGRIKCKTFCQESRFPLAYCLRLRLELQNLKMTMTYLFRPIIVQPFSSNSSNSISFDLFMKNIWLDFSVKICIVCSLCEHLDLFDKTLGLPTNVHDRIKAMVPSTKCISNFYCCYFLFLLLSQSTVASRITFCWSHSSFICIHNRIYSKSPKSNIWFNTQSTSCCVWNGHFYFSLKCE